MMPATPDPPTREQIQEIADVVVEVTGLRGGAALGIALTIAHRRPEFYRQATETRAHLVALLRDARVSVLGPRVSEAARPVGVRDEIYPDPVAPVDPAGSITPRQWRGVSANSSYRHAEGCAWREEGWPLADDGQVIPCTCGVTEAYDRGTASRITRHSLILGAIEAILAVQDAKRERERHAARLEMAERMTGRAGRKARGKLAKAERKAKAKAEHEAQVRAAREAQVDEWAVAKARCWRSVRDLRQARRFRLLDK